MQSHDASPACSHRLAQAAAPASRVISADILRPSQLGPAERQAWAAFQAATPDLRRAFFSHGFAEACERAHGRAFVAVLRQGGVPVGFLPFQFASPWHRRFMLAERIGGELSDNAGLVAEPGLRTSPPELLRHARLGAMFITHLSASQRDFGLEADEERVGHVIALPDGAAGYFVQLAATNKSFQQDTERRLRKLEKDFGALEFSFTPHPDAAAVHALIAAKRAQYARTGAEDPFDNPERLRLVDTLAQGAGPDCVPVLTTLAAGGQLLAQHFGLLHHGHLNYWFPVYDPEARKTSPGRMLLWHTIKQADLHGVTFIDRGEGDSQAKRDFSTGTRQFGRAGWYQPGWRGTIARGWQALAWRHRATRAGAA